MALRYERVSGVMLLNVWLEEEGGGGVLERRTPTEPPSKL